MASARSCLLKTWPAVLLALVATAVSSAADRDLQAGRPVAAALQSLEDSGLQFLYSSALVPDTLLVVSAPRSHDRVAIANELLSPHGLRARRVRPSLYVIVRDTTVEPRGLIGRVVDDRSGALVVAARVELAPLGLVRWTDASGRFEFDALPPASYALRVAMPEFADLEQHVELAPASDSGPVELRLQRSQLAEVVVTASRYTLSSTAEDGALRLEGAALARQPDVADDPLRALRNLPGFAHNGVSSESHVRGGETGDVLVMLDGFPLRQAYHLAAFQSPFSVLDEDLIQQIDVYTGGFPARYGNRMAGVVDIATISADQRQARHSVGLSLFSARGRTLGQWERGEWLLAARHGTLRQTLDAFGIRDWRPGFADVMTRTSFRPSDTLDISANLLWARDSFVNIAEDEHARLDSSSRYLWVRARWQVPDHWTASLWLGHTRLATSRLGGIDKSGIVEGSMEDRRFASIWDARLLLDRLIFAQQSLQLGGEWTHQAGDLHYRSTADYSDLVSQLFDRSVNSAVRVDLRPVVTRSSWFAAHRWQLAAPWVLETGLRAQRGSGDAGWYLDPRVSLRWSPLPRTALRLHWGRFHQQDEVHEWRLEDGRSAPASVQQSDHLIIGWEQRLPRGAALRLEAFRKSQGRPRPRFENLQHSLEILPELSPDRVRVAADGTDMVGAELSLSLERETWSTWAAVSAGRASDEFGDRDVPRSWEQRLAITGGFEWRRGPWSLAAVVGQHSGWPTTRLIAAAGGAVALMPRNSSRLPAYGSLDLHADYRRPLAMGALRLSFDLANAGNRRNICCTDLEIDSDPAGDPILIAEDSVTLRTVPSLSVSWEF